MQANGVLQTCVGTGVAGAPLSLSPLPNVPPFSSKFTWGANGDSISVAVQARASGVFAFAAIGHLSDASTFVIDQVLSTWDGTTADDTSPAAVALAAGVEYLVYPVHSAEMMIGAWPGAVATISADSRRALLGHGSSALSGATVTLQANTLYTWPSRWQFAATLKRLYYGLTTPVASANVRLGVWSMRHDGGGGRLLADSGLVTGAAGSLIGATVNEVRLPMNGLWVGIISDSPIAVRAYVPNELGPLGWGSGTAHYYNSYTITSRALSSGLPDPLPPPGAVQSSTSVSATPAVWGGL